jgi:hypothetical protein
MQSEKRQAGNLHATHCNMPKEQHHGIKRLAKCFMQSLDHDTGCAKTHDVALKAESKQFGACGSESVHAALGYVSPGWTLKGTDL